MGFNPDITLAPEIGKGADPDYRNLHAAVILAGGGITTYLRIDGHRSAVIGPADDSSVTVPAPLQRSPALVAFDHMAWWALSAVAVMLVIAGLTQAWAELAFGVLVGVVLLGTMADSRHARKRDRARFTNT